MVIGGAFTWNYEGKVSEREKKVVLKEKFTLISGSFNFTFTFAYPLTSRVVGHHR